MDCHTHIKSQFEIPNVITRSWRHDIRISRNRKVKILAFHIKTRWKPHIVIRVVKLCEITVLTSVWFETVTRSVHVVTGRVGIISPGYNIRRGERNGHSLVATCNLVCHLLLYVHFRPQKAWITFVEPEKLQFIPCLYLNN